MWFFFRTDEADDRLLALFSRFGQRLNVALPAEAAVPDSPLVQTVTRGRPGSLPPGHFPCWAGEGKAPVDYVMRDADFPCGLRLPDGRNGKEIFLDLRARWESGVAFTGILLGHLDEAGLAVLEELLRELEKRCLDACFYSDLIPGYERTGCGASNHV